MRKVYVAGCYSANSVIEVLQNIGKGEKAAAMLFRMGFYPFCPWHDASYVKDSPNHDFDVKQFQEHSMAWLEVSDSVFVLKGYEKSKGTLKEIERANELGIPVHYSEDSFFTAYMPRVSTQRKDA
jgi:hypothetical protein